MPIYDEFLTALRSMLPVLVRRHARLQALIEAREAEEQAQQ